MDFEKTLKVPTTTMTTSGIQQSSGQVDSGAKTPPQPPSTVFVHVDAGHIFQVQVGDKIHEILGPATVKIVNNDATQPVPLQLTAPPAPGQLVQQIVDENGMLVHLIIKSQAQVNTPVVQTNSTNNSSSGTVSTPGSGPGGPAIMPLVDSLATNKPALDCAASPSNGKLLPPQAKSPSNHIFLPKVLSFFLLNLSYHVFFCLMVILLFFYV